MVFGNPLRNKNINIIPKTMMKVMHNWMRGSLMLLDSFDNTMKKTVVKQDKIMLLEKDTQDL